MAKLKIQPPLPIVPPTKSSMEVIIEDLINLPISIGYFIYHHSMMIIVVIMGLIFGSVIFMGIQQMHTDRDTYIASQKELSIKQEQDRRANDPTTKACDWFANKPISELPARCTKDYDPTK